MQKEPSSGGAWRAPSAPLMLLRWMDRQLWSLGGVCGNSLPSAVFADHGVPHWLRGAPGHRRCHPEGLAERLVGSSSPLLTGLLPGVAGL